MRMLITGGDVIGWSGNGHELIRGGDVVIEGDRILYVGPQFEGEVDKRIDASGKIVSPGLINTHVHTGIHAGMALQNDPGKTDYFGTNYLSFSSCSLILAFIMSLEQ